MLTLVTATPGSGKTLKAIELIFNFLNDGRNVWTNISGIKISGVRTFEDDKSNPFDWRKLEAGSVVIYDEAQKHPAFSKRDLLKNYAKEEAETIANIAWDLDYHRHNAYDIVLITQSPKLINTHTLDFVGEHLHLRRLFGLKQATIYHFPEHKLNPSTKSVRDEAIHKEIFKFPKHLFKFYESATEHTHKTKIPTLYIIIGIIVFLILPYLIYSHYAKSKLFSASDTKKVSPPISQNLPNTQTINSSNLDYECRKGENLNNSKCIDWFNDLSKKEIHYDVSKPYDLENVQYNYQVKELPQFVGCVKFDGKYYAYSQQGTRLNVSQADCKRYMNGDRPFNPFYQKTMINNTI